MTLTGTYRAAQRLLEVDLAPDHELLLGGAVEAADEQWRRTLAFAIVLALLALVAHVAVLGAGGAWYREAVQPIAGA